MSTTTGTKPEIELGAPQKLVSIGSWALLLELRRLFTRLLQEAVHHHPSWESSLTRLLKQSIKTWKAEYAKPNFEKFLPELQKNRETLGCDLIGYLEDRLSRLGEGQDVLESLILPYLMSYEATGKFLHWWYPDDDYIDLYYETTDHGAKSDPARPPLYPFLGPATLRRLREAPGITQAPLEATGFAELLASGMRSFQTKVIGSFLHMYNPKSLDEDRLVGNGSGLMYVLSDAQGGKLGVLFFCTPVFGLFHEILLQRHAPAGGEPFFHDNFVCARHLSAEPERIASLGEPLPGFSWKDSDHRLAVCSFVHPEVPGQESPRSTRNVVCLGCAAEECFFDTIARKVAPPAQDFLLGIRGVAARAELERSRDLLRKVTHTLSGPLAAAKQRYEDTLRELAGCEDTELIRRAVTRLGAVVSIVYHICESNRAFVRLLDGKDVPAPSPANAEAYTDLSVLRDAMADEELLRTFQTGGIRIDWNTTGEERPIKGSPGTWIVVLYTLIDNAIHAAHHAGEKGLITVSYSYGDDFRLGDPVRYMSLIVTNTSLPLAPERLQDMQACLKGDKKSMPPDPMETDSMGVGLALIGQHLRGLGVRTAVHQHPDNRVSIRLYEIEMYVGRP